MIRSSDNNGNGTAKDQNPYFSSSAICTSQLTGYQHLDRIPATQKIPGINSKYSQSSTGASTAIHYCALRQLLGTDYAPETCAQAPPGLLTKCRPELPPHHYVRSDPRHLCFPDGAPTVHPNTSSSSPLCQSWSWRTRTFAKGRGELRSEHEDRKMKESRTRKQLLEEKRKGRSRKVHAKRWEVKGGCTSRWKPRNDFQGARKLIAANYRYSGQEID